jgi:hypothetical protein
LAQLRFDLLELGEFTLVLGPTAYLAQINGVVLRDENGLFEALAVVGVVEPGEAIFNAVGRGDDFDASSRRVISETGFTGASPFCADGGGHGSGAPVLPGDRKSMPFQAAPEPLL